MRPEMSKSAVYMKASGRVQGVGFRFFVRQQATAFGLTGWVRNRADGSVEIHAEGDRELLEAFAARVERGPTFGRVDDLTVEWIEATGSYYSFDIEF